MTRSTNQSNSTSRSNRGAAWIFFGCIILVPLTLTAFARMNQAKPTIEWSEDLAGALIEANTSNKLVLVDFTAAWCPACQIMKREVLPVAVVENVIRKKFVPVRIDVDKNDKANDIASLYGTRSLPTYLVLNGDGKEIARLEGSRPISEFVGWLESFSSETMSMAGSY